MKLESLFAQLFAQCTMPLQAISPSCLFVCLSLLTAMLNYIEGEPPPARELFIVARKCEDSLDVDRWCTRRCWSILEVLFGPKFMPAPYLWVWQTSVIHAEERRVKMKKQFPTNWKILHARLAFFSTLTTLQSECKACNWSKINSVKLCLLRSGVPNYTVSFFTGPPPKKFKVWKTYVRLG